MNKIKTMNVLKELKGLNLIIITIVASALVLGSLVYWQSTTGTNNAELDLSSEAELGVYSSKISEPGFAQSGLDRRLSSDA